MSTNPNGNGNEKGRLSPLDTLPKVTNKIIINLHLGGRVTGQMPTDMKVTMYMIGEFFKQIGPTLSYNPPSPIVVPTVGIKIPGGN